MKNNEAKTTSEIFSQRMRDAIPEMLKDLEQYIIGDTYSSKHHYLTEQGIQTIDMWHANGSIVSTARDTVIKYVNRYGKKKGNNKDDLYKAVHYLLMMMYTDHYDVR